MKYQMVLAAMLCFFTYGYAQEKPSHPGAEKFESEKFYVSKDKIYIDESSIWVNVEGLTIPVKSLYVDHGGIYMKRFRNERKSYWTCANCGAQNYDGVYKCWRCDEYKEWGFYQN